MGDINKILSQANEALADKLKLLDILEKEKQEIIEHYKIASAVDRVLLENEMRKSEQKYKNLYDDMIVLADKVKKLKKHYL